MKILTIVRMSGGTGVHVEQILKYSRHEHKIIDPPRVPIPGIRAMFSFILGFILGLIEKKDVIHAHYLIPQGLLGLFLSSLTGKPLVVTVHGSDLYRLPCLDIIRRVILKNAIVICVSKHLAQKAGCGIVIPNGVSKEDGKKISLKHPAVLFVGRLKKHKIGFLFSVIEKMRDVNFYIVGAGRFLKKLEKKVHCVGWVPHKHIFDYYLSSDVLISTSQWEGFGLAILEAMRVGLPVVARPVGAIPEIVKDGENGFLASTPDEFVKKVRYLLEDKKLREKIGKAGKKTAKRYRWDKMVEEIDDIYERIRKI